MTIQPEDAENYGELDQVFGGEDQLLPSSGFAASVMSAIAENALAPQPLAFPWRLAIPGIAAMVAALGLVLWLAVQTLRNQGQSAAGTGSIGESMAWLRLESATAWSSFLHTTAGPAVLALAVAFLCFLLMRRIAGHFSLL